MEVLQGTCPVYEPPSTLRLVGQHRIAKCNCIMLL